MQDSLYPFTENEAVIREVVRKTVTQYHDYPSPRIGEKVRQKLRLHAHRTTDEIVATVLKHGVRRVKVFISATLDGKPYEIEMEMEVTVWQFRSATKQ